MLNRTIKEYLMRTCLLLCLIASLSPSPGIAEPATEYATNYVYKLGRGDRLRIVTYGEDKLSGEFAVNSDGMMSFPLIGDVTAAGLTLAEFRQELARQLGRRFLKDPKISAEVINFRPVYILGEVMRPGEFSFVEGMTIYSLVAKAGGFSYRGNQKYAFIRHEHDTEERRFSISSGTAVYPGDTVRIPQKYF